jgi:hypothetical protein
MVNSNIIVSFHRAMEMKRRLEDDEIERQLKCKIVTWDNTFSGASKSKYHTKARFSYMTRGKHMYT